jgi:FkbM family methyltransferase
MKAPMISYAVLGRTAPSMDRAYWKALRHDLFYRFLARRPGLELETLGDASRNYAWTVCPENLDEKSAIISAGAGHDISFELALIQRFGCRVILLDLSPTGLATMALPQNQHPNLLFLPCALMGHDGSVTLNQPGNPAEGSFSPVVGTRAGPRVEGVCLLSLMKKYGLGQVDLLKIDIERAEYEVMDSVLRHKLPIPQICVEYHNKVLPGIRTSSTARSLLQFWVGGWRILHKSGSNHTLWNDRLVRKSWH